MTLARTFCPKCKTDISMAITTVMDPVKPYYCPGCGAQVLGTCAKCQGQIDVFQKFCTKCGVENPLYIKP